MDHVMSDDTPNLTGEEFLLEDPTDDLSLEDLGGDDSHAAKKPCVATDGFDDGNPGTSAGVLATPPNARTASAPQQGPNMLAQSVPNPRAQVNQPPPGAGSPEPAMAPPTAPPPTQPVHVNGAVSVSAEAQPPPPRPLHRPRLAVAGSVSLPCRRRAVVTLLLPEAGADANRADILVRLSALLRGHMFPNGTIPPYEATPSEALRAYDDPHPEFTASKTNGATTPSVRNVPIGYDQEDIKEFLLNAMTKDDLPWLEDLQHFHRISDPFEGVAFTIMDGLPIPCPDDPTFKRIPASIPLEEGGLPMLLNFSSHTCSFCASNHWDVDHESFAARRRQRLPNKHTITVGQLQQSNGQILGAHAVPVLFRNDPGLLFIGLDSLVETWTYVLCDFRCGKALDSAMSHMASGQHAAQLRATSHPPPAKEKYSTWRALTLLEEPRIATFVRA
ncbi:unnamed protein product [Closterium sp. NIES-65]|nr:unnamed protein product [Closterium sp. NIES-65]